MRPGEHQPGGGPQPPWSNPYQQPGHHQPGKQGGGQQPGPLPPGHQPGPPPSGQQQPAPPQPAQPQPGQQAGYPSGPQQPPGYPPPGGQQPGYPQAQPYPPYQGPTSGQWQPPGQLTGGPPEGRNRGGRAAIAIVVATAVIAAAVITGVFLLGDDGDKGTPSGGGTASPSPEPTATDDTDDEEDSGGGSDPDDPRQSVLERPDPVVAPDWQVQTIENRHNAFDVPPDWEVGSDGYMVGYEDNRESAEGELLVAMSGVSTYLDGWCDEAEYGVSWRAVAGTKGGQGATSTEEAAENEARNWALAAYDQEQRGRLEMSQTEPFESDHGISGHTVTATITDVPDDPENRCGTFDGKVVTVSYLDVNSDLATWVLVMDTGFDEELDDATIEQMMNSLRPYATEE
ncbi:hypothetical protein [Streptomyces sp. B6B3]|uniref:hypothetical protein n=1 Tax=Streptomyces sp. B6B3 TaxID=3153570 RepID=UPI00325DC869